jgi:Ser/Thr protein kinase RdoA (MazF antagonist)
VTAHLYRIAQEFSGGQPINSITGLGNGLINDTFRVNTDTAAFVLQRINQQVFPQPERLISNLQQLGRHIRQQAPAAVRLKIPKVLLTGKRQGFFQDQEQQFWRALELIPAAESRERLSKRTEAEQVGFALAHFHRLCSTLPTEQLHDTLPGFHNTPNYFQHYQTLNQSPPKSKSNKLFDYCKSFIENFRDNIDTLENARQQGLLIERVIHGDPKLNNFLFQVDSDQIISLIDLDTVKPGLVHYDIGDCLRSCCHNPENNSFDLDYCVVILSSYLQEAGVFFTQADYDFLYAAILLIPFELGLRFFSDYLAGNIYFKVKEPQQNLLRAVAQFQLCENIAKQSIDIENLILVLRNPSAEHHK